MRRDLHEQWGPPAHHHDVEHARCVCVAEGSVAAFSRLILQAAARQRCQMGLDTSVGLLLDTEVDPSVDFTALSVLSRGDHENTTTNGRRGSWPRLPVAGSEGWLSSMVEVGRQEVCASSCTVSCFMLLDYANADHAVQKLG